MNPEREYITINKSLWNNKVQHHMDSDFYDVPSFVAGKNPLKEIELHLLGDIRGKRLLHLQCHFGQDTIALARLGAQVTGVDFSDKAIEQAQQLAEQCGVEAQFICTDIYSLPKVLSDQFDLVFTSYGTIGWLPDMDQWASVVAHFIKPGGQFLIVDFHPVLWMFDNDFTQIQYAYFKHEAIVETLSGTYADRLAPLQQTEIGWNHSLSEILQALLGKGLQLLHFEEYDYSPFNCFNHTEEFEPGKYRIRHLGNKIPMLYSILMNR